MRTGTTLWSLVSSLLFIHSTFSVYLFTVVFDYVNLNEFIYVCMCVVVRGQPSGVTAFHHVTPTHQAW